MIIVMRPEATKEQLEAVVKAVEGHGYKPHVIYGSNCNVVGAVGDERTKQRLQSIEALDGVEKVMPVLQPFKLAGREMKAADTVFSLGKGIEVGGKQLVIMAGPCSVESEAQILESAHMVKRYGAHILRGGAFKPRTSPYSFQGLEKEGLELLQRAGRETGMPTITEVINPRDVDLVAAFVDIFQIGARNMQNFALLKEVGQAKKPVFLKRGMSSTITEFLMSAEYILSSGSPHVMLCERGIRTFETSTRFTLDLNAVPVLKRLTHLPVIVDPSHGTGHWNYVGTMAKAAIAAGADGLMVEVHPNPAMAVSDGAQSLNERSFAKMMQDIAPFVTAAGRHL